MSALRLTAIASAAALLVACGGSDDDSGPKRGDLIDPARVVGELTPAQIDAATASSGLQALTGTARCGVKILLLNYVTVGAKGEKGANASGALLVPTGPLGSDCATKPTPLVAYSRGTDLSKTRTMANPQDGETLMLAAFYAAQGYSVVATDYLGYAQSTYPFHPYLHADSEATSVIDSVRAARIAVKPVDVALSGKVMFTGYSQGGHASMASQRAAESNYGSEFNVVASAHLAGPYNMAGSMKVPDAIAGYQFFVPYLVTAWQKVYGGIYSSVAAAFKAPYAAGIENLLPSPTLNYTTLVTTGALPGGTPDQARDALFQSAFLADAQTNANSPLFLAAKKNDLLGWSPKARTLLCGGAGDPTVPPAVHMNVAQADFSSRGLSNVTSVDVDPFVQAAYGIAGKAPTDPTSAAFATYYGSYHGTYEPPFCHAQARAVFDTLK